MSKLRLSMGLTVNPRTKPLLKGEVSVEAVDMSYTTFDGGSELFWRQLKFGDFDISEMSLASLLVMAASHRAADSAPDWIGIPVFTSRRYFHTGVVARTDRGIKVPKDLHGKKVGVPEYQQTAAVWTRGVLMDDFDFDPTQVDWYMERVPDISHAGSTGFAPPPGVTINQIPKDESIGSRLADGSLDASLRYLLNNNLVDRSRLDIDASAEIEPLFDAAEPQRYHQAHGLFPINHGIAIKRRVVEEHPWVVLNLFHGFEQARDRVSDAVSRYLDDFTKPGIIDQATAASITQERFQYGIARNRHELETLYRYAFEQGLTDELLTHSDIFDVRTLSL